MLRVAAMRRSDPAEIALLLRAVRPAVPLVAGGLVLTIAAGVALTDRLGIDFGATWLSLTFALLAFMVVAGAVAGRYDRHTRELAEELAAGEPRRRRNARAPASATRSTCCSTARCSPPRSRSWR